MSENLENVSFTAPRTAHFGEIKVAYVPTANPVLPAWCYALSIDRNVPEIARSPKASEDTELVLMELGLEWDRIEDLKARGAIA